MKGRVFIIGLGLIGGSLALCIKRAHPEAIVIGFDINKEEAIRAKLLGIIDEVVHEFEEEAAAADLIIISTPVDQTEKLFSILSAVSLKPGVILTDTGSTKGRIASKSVELMNKGVTFIGGHPMAGSHKSGITAAKEILFENAFYLLTPDVKLDSKKIEILKEWLKGTKAKFLTVTPDNHDFITGVVSHFPHVIAASLVHQADKLAKAQSLIPRLAAGGFRDITRIASSNPEMWRDITLHNGGVLLELLEKWKEEMGIIQELIEQRDGNGIYRYFQEAKQFRDGLPSGAKGAIPAFYDLFVDVPDYPGVISEITGYLASENISITNIRILETREEIYGVLVISFQTEADRKRAERCIGNKTDYPLSIVE